MESMESMDLVGRYPIPVNPIDGVTSDSCSGSRIRSLFLLPSY